MISWRLQEEGQPAKRGGRDLVTKQNQRADFVIRIWGISASGVRRMRQELDAPFRYSVTDW